MHKKDASASLKESIALLEAMQLEDKRLLKEELSYFFEHLKPSHVIKESVIDLITSLHSQTNLFGTLFGTASGYLAKAVFGPRPTLLNKLGARFLQQIVALAVTRNSPALAGMALNIVSNLRRKMENQRNQNFIRENLSADGAVI